jgi:hypothetical protein
MSISASTTPTLERAGLRLRLAALRVRDAEVAQLHVAALRQEDVRGRDVAMHDVHRLALHVARVVRVVEGLEDLVDHEDGQVPRHVQLLLRARPQEAQRVGAVDELEGDEVLPAHVAEVEDLDDLRVRELRRQLRLVDEHRDERRVGREVREDPLDDEDLLEPVRGANLRAEDLGHASDGEALEERVAAELRG